MSLSELFEERAHIALNEQSFPTRVSPEIGNDVLQWLSALQFLPNVGARRVERANRIVVDVEDHGSILVHDEAEIGGTRRHHGCFQCIFRLDRLELTSSMSEGASGMPASIARSCFGAPVRSTEREESLASVDHACNENRIAKRDIFSVGRTVGVTKTRMAQQLTAMVLLLMVPIAEISEDGAFAPPCSMREDYCRRVRGRNVQKHLGRHSRVLSR